MNLLQNQTKPIVFGFIIPPFRIQITGIAWMDQSTVATTGQDGNVKIWNVTWKAA